MLCSASCPFGPENGLNFSPNSSSISNIPVLFSLACLSTIIGATVSVDALLITEDLRLSAETTLMMRCALIGLPLVLVLVGLRRPPISFLPAQWKFVEGVRS